MLTTCPGLHSIAETGEARIRTRDLLIASPASLPLGHRVTHRHVPIYKMKILLQNGSSYGRKSFLIPPVTDTADGRNLNIVCQVTVHLLYY